ncbi:uncharacterized protein EI90DRAFT_1570349 [Cantharellus anzutake]|uniref:uncharacterized protein n=1 Tax=Cantharellus anzutake TaxID=1750568 RepID=UPI0019058C94|nr:uncharacterized protein EI90DRAFT_1570349 [Cantharellus anzutake]KAF8328391.1 hypothetical protein EI90DRAFT_1570349 [Cantharellus anzutake]
MSKTALQHVLTVYLIVLRQAFRGSPTPFRSRCRMSAYVKLGDLDIFFKHDHVEVYSREYVTLSLGRLINVEAPTRYADFEGFIALDAEALFNPDMKRFLAKEARVEVKFGQFKIHYTTPSPLDPEKTLEYGIHPGFDSHVLISKPEPIEEKVWASRFHIRVPPQAIKKGTDVTSTFTLHASAKCTFTYLAQPIVERISRSATSTFTVKCLG